MSRAPALVVDDGPGVESQVVEPGPAARAPFTAAEVGRALGRPVNPPTETVALFGMRLAEYAAVGGPERVLVQTATGNVAAAVAGAAGGSVTIRDGAAVIRTGDAVVIVHVRDADPATTRAALHRLADLAARPRTPDPAG